MKRLLHTFLLIAVLPLLCNTIPLLAAETARWYGLPFVTNFLPKQYNAHAINYDITTDNNGSVFVANFEGLLYFDGASWRKIYTPGISRITRVERDRKGRIWIGGYNVFGYLKADRNGQLAMHTIVSDLDNSSLGEVNGLMCKNNKVYVHTNTGNTYVTENGKLKPYKGSQAFDTEQTVTFAAQGLTVNVKHADGLTFRYGSTVFAMTEKDGLCSNAINTIHYDGNHTLWGATNNGIFAIEVPSVFTQIGESQGLQGEVYAVNKLHDTYYIGTLQGLYRTSGTMPVLVDNTKSACWDIINLGTNELLAATSEGVLRIRANGSIQKINSYNTTAVCLGKNAQDIYAGEIDGIYAYSIDGTRRRRISPVGNILSIHRKGTSLFAETVNGQLWEFPQNATGQPILRRKKFDTDTPKQEFHDAYGRLWTTTGVNSKELMLASDLPQYSMLKLWTKPLAHLSVNDIYCDSENTIMAGGPFGVIYCDVSAKNHAFGAYAKNTIPVFIRNVSMGDEVLWGGYSPDKMKPQNKISGLQIPSDCNSLTITFSIRDRLAVTPVLYRYRINKDRWTDWDTNEEIRINTIDWGRSTIDIEACDMFGRITPTAHVEWYKKYPIYLCWYAILLYLAIIAAGITAIGKWRMRKLTQAKVKLEHLVSERTSELSNALTNLKKAQNELVRMERAATAGKLTQGLIDRILNPINYINNFSKLTSGLASDLAEDIEDEKDNMTEDNYEDCLDILQMMKQNLKKIEEHGVNTTRMLRAMEAMLKTNVKELRDSDLKAVCQQAISISCEYQKDKLQANGISITAHLPEESVIKPLDSDTFCTTLISVISNAVYAVTKRKQRIISPNYKPEVTITLATNEAGKAVITIHDNGIGIEEAIRTKIFDPFFTTKTTSEAAGVGLYLAREVVLAHHGTMELGPQIPGQTDFIITL